jgi:hypothetical protein
MQIVPHNIKVTQLWNYADFEKTVSNLLNENVYFGCASRLVTFCFTSAVFNSDWRL